jgi:hypothetical protein
MQSETKKAILIRTAHTPVFEVVPEHVIKMFDHVIEQTSADAIIAHPDDKWGQIEFWKSEILSRVLPKLRGQVAGFFHEYIAATLRGDDGLNMDPYGFDAVPPYGGESRAQYDAYMACSASLA